MIVTTSWENLSTLRVVFGKEIDLRNLVLVISLSRIVCSEDMLACTDRAGSHFLEA